MTEIDEPMPGTSASAFSASAATGNKVKDPVAVAAVVTENQLYQLQDLILKDASVVSKWRNIKDDLTSAKMDRALIDRQWKEGYYPDAVLKALQSWCSHQGPKATLKSLVDIFERNQCPTLVEILTHLKLLPTNSTSDSLFFGFEPPVHTFVGRERKLNEIHAMMTSGKQLGVIHGNSGIGKSELARKYAWENRKYFGGNLVWIETECLESLITSLQNLTAKLGIEIPTNSPKNTTEAVQYLFTIVFQKQNAQDRKCLFIFNDVQLPVHKFNLVENLNPYLSRNISVLFTTKFVTALEGEGLQFMLLDGLEPRACSQLLLHSVKPANDYEVVVCEKLANKLQHQPLALNLAIHYIRESKWVREEETLAPSNPKHPHHWRIQGALSRKVENPVPSPYGKSLIDAYLKGYERMEEQFTQEGYKDPINKTLALTLMKIRETAISKGELQLPERILELMAFMNPNHITAEWIKQMNHGQIQFATLEDIQASISGLENFGLVSSSEGGHKKLKIHSRVQQFMRTQLSDQEERNLCSAIIQSIHETMTATADETGHGQPETETKNLCILHGAAIISAAEWLSLEERPVAQIKKAELSTLIENALWC